MYWRKKDNICLQNVVQWKHKAAENVNTQVKYKYFKIVLKDSTWVNVHELTNINCSEQLLPQELIGSDKTTQNVQNVQSETTPSPNRNQKTWAQCNDEQDIQSDHQANGIPSPCFWPLKSTSLSALPTLDSRSYRSSSTLSMRACSFLQISWRQRRMWCLLTTLYWGLILHTAANNDFCN